VLLSALAIAAGTGLRLMPVLYERKARAGGNAPSSLLTEFL